MLFRNIIFRLSSFNKQKIIHSNYDELVSMVANKYNNKEFKNSNTACLYQMHHQFRIFNPGHAVLDIGAGPNYNWTDLALKLVEDDKNSHIVISNDIAELTKRRPNNVFIKGDFIEEQVKTNIALSLKSRKFNTILIDVSPEFTGDLNDDGKYINDIIADTFIFAQTFLQKGGTIVCKTLNCQTTNILEDAGKTFFHECNKFIPSVMRHRSPVFFFVLKGFLINYHYDALKQFLSKYRGNIKNKNDLIKQYQNKYNWDPITSLRRKVKDDIPKFRSQGKSDKDIEKMFENDPNIKIKEILKQFREVERAKMMNDDIAIKKAAYKYTEGALFKQQNQIPSTREEWIDFLEKMINQTKNKINKSKPKSNTAPLQDNQIYMKAHLKLQEENQKPLYIQSDLHSEYDEIYEINYLCQQIQKLKIQRQSSSQIKQKLKKTLIQKKKLTPDDFFDMNIEKEQKSMFDNIRILFDELKKMSNKQYDSQVNKNNAQEIKDEYFAQRKPKIDRSYVDHRRNK